MQMRAFGQEEHVHGSALEDTCECVLLPSFHEHVPVESYGGMRILHDELIDTRVPGSLSLFWTLKMCLRSSRSARIMLKGLS